MLDLEREQQILALLTEKKAATVYEFSQKLFVSESTIRRDLTRMEQKGLITRTFGGAIIKSAPSIEDTSFLLREKENIPEKRALAKEATKFIEPNSAIFLDSSTTTLQIVTMLNEFKNLLIITNGLAIANELVAKTKHRIVLLGGNVQPSTNSILGTRAEKMAESYHVSLAILSTSSVNHEFGFSEQTEEQAALKRIMIENADRVIFLVDKKKLDKKSLARTCPISRATCVISNAEFGPEYKACAPSTFFINVSKN